MERTKLHDSRYASSLIEASLDPLIVINIDGKITDMNQAKVNITGVERKKLMGSNFYDYFTDPQKAQGVYTQVFKYGAVWYSICSCFPCVLSEASGRRCG